MISIRRRVAFLVVLSLTLLLVVGGEVLIVVFRQAMTLQFDDALAARAAALQSLTRFDGTTVEMDFAGEAMPHYGRFAEAEFFVAWVRDGRGWRELERSESLRAIEWPPSSLASDMLGVRDVRLPNDESGRVVVIEFIASREVDEDRDLHGVTSDAAAATGGIERDASAPDVRLLVALSRGTLDHTFAILNWCLAGVGGALALASVAASRWAVGRGLTPLRELSRRVQSLGPDTLGTRFDADPLPAELRPIAEQLNALLARLDEAFQREQRFSAAASHELRTPIAELRLLLEVAASRPRTDAEWSHTAETALAVLARAQSLCETLLRLARSTASSASTDPSVRGAVAAVLRDETDRVIALHRGDARCVRIECDPNLGARVDQATLRSILGNLLDNALRHGTATPDAPVVVQARRREGQIQIDITNPALDIRQDNLARLFEPFWQNDSSRSEQRGHGLGLAVARSLARSVGGDIVARSDRPDSITLALTLPSAEV